MIPDSVGQQLHDLVTRGEALSSEERELLQRWYAQHDEAEMAQLNAAPSPSRLADLQSQVQQVTAQVVVHAQRIEALTKENAQLRQEIAQLQRLLSTKPVGQPA